MQLEPTNHRPQTTQFNLHVKEQNSTFKHILQKPITYIIFVSITAFCLSMHIQRINCNIFVESSLLVAHCNKRVLFHYTLMIACIHDVT